MGWGVLDIGLGAVCLATALTHLVLLAARRVRVVPAAAHVLMGLGMAAMFVPAVDPVPQPVWVGLFVVSGAWFAAAALRAGSLLGEAGHHVVGAVAMLFMLLVGHEHGAAAAGEVDPEHTHHAAGGGGAPALIVTAFALAFAAWFAADLVRAFLRRTGVRAATAELTPAAPGTTAGEPDAAADRTTPESTAAEPAESRTPATPLAATAAHLAMSAAMVVMLLGMS